MKKLIFISICILMGINSYAQNVVYVAVNESIKLKSIIENIFQAQLISEGNTVRVCRDSGVFAGEIYDELAYQEAGNVPAELMKRFGEEIVPNELCVVTLEKNRSLGDCIFVAKVFDIESKKLEKTATYIGYAYENEGIKDIESPALIKKIAYSLLADLGYAQGQVEQKVKDADTNYDDEIEKRKEENKKEQKKQNKIDRKEKREKNWRKIKDTFTPEDKGAEFRIVSSFNTTGLFGVGMNFHKSYFQLGFDAQIASLPTDIEPDRLNFGDNIQELKDTYLLLNNKENISENGKIFSIESEYVNPMFQISVNPGLNLKYVAIECGLGVFICENMKLTDHITSNYYDQYEGTKTTKCYFYARPTIVGYIPVSDNMISLSIGYNICPNAKPLNGLVFGIGFCW